MVVLPKRFAWAREELSGFKKCFVCRLNIEN